MMKFFNALLFLTIFGLFVIACNKNILPRTSKKIIKEYSVLNIPLYGEASEKRAEISGLAWHNNNLVLLPQYPHRFAGKHFGSLFYIPKKEIYKFLKGKISKIKPRKIKFSAPGLKKYSAKSDGYESIAFAGDTVFMTIEVVRADSSFGFVVKGFYDTLSNKITLFKSTLTKVHPPANLRNMSQETITLTPNRVLTLYEANGINVNPSPGVDFYNKNLKMHYRIPLSHIEYRITDATSVDSKNMFWVTNYYWPGEKELLKPGADSLIIKYGKGASYYKYKGVERLVQLEITKRRVALTDVPPIYLKLKNNGGDNWEGIARLDKLGFLIATDTYPKTILGFVKYPQ